MRVIEKEIKNKLAKKITSGKKAKNIMKSPVKVVESEFKIKDVHKIMVRFGYNGIPIVEDEKLVGIISRRDIDKAINHGFSNAPVRAYMSRNLILAKEDDGVEELKKKVIENEIGRIPIVKNGNLVGIVTRTDILRALYEQKMKKNKKEVDSEKRKFETDK